MYNYDYVHNRHNYDKIMYLLLLENLYINNFTRSVSKKETLLSLWCIIITYYYILTRFIFILNATSDGQIWSSYYKLWS